MNFPVRLTSDFSTLLRPQSVIHLDVKKSFCITCVISSNSSMFAFNIDLFHNWLVHSKLDLIKFAVCSGFWKFLFFHFMIYGDFLGCVAELHHAFFLSIFKKNQKLGYKNFHFCPAEFSKSINPYWIVLC